MHNRKKPRFLFRIGLTIIFSANISFAQLSTTTTFEGILHSTVTQKGKTSKGRIYIKGQKVRIDLVSPSTNQPITILLNAEKQRGFYLDSLDKTADEIDLFKSEQSSQKTLSTPTCCIETGNTEIIAGYLAKETLFHYEDGRTDESWTSPQFEISENVVRAIQALCNGTPKNEMSKAPHPHFVPLRTIRKLSDQTIWSYQEVEKIELGHISETLFEIPKDFQIHQLESLNQTSTKN